jgi:hypothetical protein
MSNVGLEGLRTLARRLPSSRRATGEQYPQRAGSIRIFFSSASVFKSGSILSVSVRVVIGFVRWSLSGQESRPSCIQG